MVGVTDSAELTCRKCGKRTEHETHWEGEYPDELYTKCTKCGYETVRR